MAANDDEDDAREESRARPRRGRRDVLHLREGRRGDERGDQPETYRSENGPGDPSDRRIAHRYNGREAEMRDADRYEARGRDERRSKDNDSDGVHERRHGRDGDGQGRQDAIGGQAETTERNRKRGSQGGNDDAVEDDEDERAQGRRKKRRPLIVVVAVGLGLLLVAGGVYYYLSRRGKVDTDDAYTDGNVVNIASQVSGQVVALEVNDNQFVHKGDVLIRIDPRQFQYSQEQAKGLVDADEAQVESQRLGVEIAKKNYPASLQLAQANLQSSKANLQLQQANFDRQKGLPKQATTQQDVDTSGSSLQQAQAAVAQQQARVVQAEPVPQNIGQSQQQVSQLEGQAEQAKGQLDQADLNIEWATVLAPQDGWVTQRNVNAGNYVQAGTQFMSLVTTDVWVTANYKETELDGMHPGQAVTIKVDAYPDLDLRGHVDSIQRGSGSKFSAFPAQNATGNFVKIVQRVPVKIVIDSGLRADEPLPLGVSVDPTVLLR